MWWMSLLVTIVGIYIQYYPLFPCSDFFSQMWGWFVMFVLHCMLFWTLIENKILGIHFIFLEKLLFFIISPNEVFGDIMVWASPPPHPRRPPVDFDEVNNLNSKNTYLFQISNRLELDLISFFIFGQLFMWMITRYDFL